MDIEFHYYITFLIAISAEFSASEAFKIAYSAQYVDDNTAQYRVCSPQNLSKSYENLISQTFDITLPRQNTDYIYTSFHFLPGHYQFASAQRRDGRKHILCTTPCNKLACVVLKNALDEGDIYWIGIASHAYADTWAHQGFTGTYDTFNYIGSPCHIESSRVEEYTRSAGIYSQRLGHIEVLDLPDRIGGKWYDYRLKNCKIDNNHRFFQAALSLFKEFARYRLNSIPKLLYKQYNTKIVSNRQKLHTLLYKVLLSSNARELNFSDRLDLYDHFTKLIIGKTIIKYDRNYWFRRDTNYSHERYTWSEDNYKNCDWYLFQEAVKKHKAFLYPFLKRYIRRADTRSDEK